MMEFFFFYGIHGNFWGIGLRLNFSGLSLFQVLLFRIVSSSPRKWTNFFDRPMIGSPDSYLDMFTLSCCFPLKLAPSRLDCHQGAYDPRIIRDTNREASKEFI